MPVELNTSTHLMTEGFEKASQKYIANKTSQDERFIATIKEATDAKNTSWLPIHQLNVRKIF